DPDRVHAAIRAFYERTADFTLLVRAEWRPGFGRPSRIYKRLSRAVGQMNFPVDAGDRADCGVSRLVALDDGRDGRANVRAWVRWYADSGEAIYAAAYATHALGSQVYMNIAFPIPLGNLTSILRLAALDVGGKPDGVLLTTLPAPGQPGDEGVYFANRLLPVRLPFDETNRVLPVAAGGQAHSATGA